MLKISIAVVAMAMSFATGAEACRIRSPYAFYYFHHEAPDWAAADSIAVRARIASYELKPTSGFINGRCYDCTLVAEFVPDPDVPQIEQLRIEVGEVWSSCDAQTPAVGDEGLLVGRLERDERGRAWLVPARRRPDPG
ncbi:hypothetical protein [Caulobacter sp. 17J65-9]|uniref:hypothetical protein n=1 Tax=Caulobacter sp. 17J65-9 TaxID=2709382 RepID=UPI0013C7BF92|nr:hypothetical protein [Caulobacter sp. 17J65-9]NEX93173.1 hypothetical protein [Caulobacter sp. 17J65-9]